MDEDKLLLGIAIAAVLVSAVGVAFTYYTVSEFNTWLTGFAVSTDTATANVTISAVTAINFTTDNINWGTGTVSGGQTNATLSTHDGATTGGSGFTSVTQGFVLENIGNYNVTLDLVTDKNSTQFIGGTAGAGPQFQYNVTNSEPSSCLNATGGTDALNLGVYSDVNISGNGTRICEIFQFLDSADTLLVDIKVVIPNDALGTKGAVMTAKGISAA